MKEKILLLRSQGLSFRAIKKELGCSSSTIWYHCSKAYQETTRQRNKERLIGNRKTRKKFFVDAFGGKCQLCGYSRCLQALEFHHLDKSAKEKHIANCMSNLAKMASLVDELSKCTLLCSCCHREVHNGITASPTASALTLNQLNDLVRHARFELAS